MGEAQSGSDPASFDRFLFSDKVARCVSRYASAGLTLRRATEDEAERLFIDASQIFPIASRSAIAAVQARNPDVVQTVCEPNQQALRAIIAYLPLNDAGLAAMTTGGLSGLHPDPAHICLPLQPPRAIYIWLVFAPGALGRSLAAITTAYRLLAPQGCPVFSSAVTPHGAKLNAAMGFRPARETYPDAPDWLVAVQSTKAQMKVAASTALGVHIARNFEDLIKIVAVRSATYLAEQPCLYDEEFDGNDLCATQFLGTVDGDPAGCVRLRFFGDFAKLERLAVRREYRSSRLAFMLVRTALAHARAKGFSTIYGHSRADLVAFWAMFGFKVMPDRPAFSFANVQYREIVLRAEVDPNAIQFGVDPMVSIRPEGAWDTEGPFDRSNAVADPARAAMIERSMRKLKQPV